MVFIKHLKMEKSALPHPPAPHTLEKSPSIGLGGRGVKSFLKPLSWTKSRVEAKAGKKGYRVVRIIATLIVLGLKSPF